MYTPEKTNSETQDPDNIRDEAVIGSLQYDQLFGGSFVSDKNTDHDPNSASYGVSSMLRKPESPRGSQFKRHLHHEVACQPQCQQACQPITSHPTVTLITIDAIAQTSAIILPRQPSQKDPTLREIIFGWDSFRTRVMLIFLSGFVIWMLVFFPLLSFNKL